VVVGELRARREAVGVGARHHEAVVDPAGVRVCHLLLGDRAAGAAGSDRVAQVAVSLDEALLHHQHRLGLDDDVAVVAVVVERGRSDGKALAERRHVALRVAGSGRDRAAVVVEPGAARVVVGAATAAMRDQELLVPRLRRLPAAPPLAGREEGEDPVLVAVLVAELLAHDERDLDALVGRRRRDVVGRVLRVVRRELLLVLGLVEERVLGGLVALLVDRLLLALPGLQLRPREDRPAVRVVADYEPGASTVSAPRGQDVAAVAQPLDEPDPATGGALLEAPVHLAAVQPHRQLRDALRGDRDDRVAARHQVGAARHDLDLDGGVRRCSPRERGKQREWRQESCTHLHSIVARRRVIVCRCRS
jgi:hypothetical protein